MKPAGWRGESHRHYLAAKGVKTKVSKNNMYMLRREISGEGKNDFKMIIDFDLVEGTEVLVPQKNGAGQFDNRLDVGGEIIEIRKDDVVVMTDEGKEVVLPNTKQNMLTILSVPGRKEKLFERPQNE